MILSIQHNHRDGRRTGRLGLGLAIAAGLIALPRLATAAPATGPAPLTVPSNPTVRLYVDRQIGGGLAGDAAAAGDAADADKAYHILKVNHIYVGGIANLFQDAGHIYTEDFVKDQDQSAMGGGMMGGMGGGMMGGMGGMGGMMGGMGGMGGGMMGGMGGMGGMMGGMGGGMMGGMGGMGGMMGGMGGGRGFGFGF